MPGTRTNRVSLKAYAQHRGVSPAAVRKAIAAGRLTAASCSRSHKGRWKIDPGLADQEWTQNTDQAKANGVGRPPAPKAEEPGLFGPVEKPGPPRPDEKAAGPKLAQAQALRMTFQAQLARIELEERMGSLVKKADVEVEAFALARAVRNRLLQLPDRIAEELAALQDSLEVHRRLDEELAEALTELSGRP